MSEISCGITLTLNGRGERTRASSPLQCGSYTSLAAPLLPQLSSLRVLAYTVIQSFHYLGRLGPLQCLTIHDDYRVAFDSERT
jgi:hypothetical protein